MFTLPSWFLESHSKIAINKSTSGSFLEVFEYLSAKTVAFEDPPAVEFFPGYQRLGRGIEILRIGVFVVHAILFTTCNMAILIFDEMTCHHEKTDWKPFSKRAFSVLSTCGLRPQYRQHYYQVAPGPTVQLCLETPQKITTAFSNSFTNFWHSPHLISGVTTFSGDLWFPAPFPSRSSPVPCAMGPIQVTSGMVSRLKCCHWNNLRLKDLEILLIFFRSWYQDPKIQSTVPWPSSPNISRKSPWQESLVAFRPWSWGNIACRSISCSYTRNLLWRCHKNTNCSFC